MPADLGLQEYRLDGEEYLAVIDEFMEAVFTRWPNVIVQVSFILIKIFLLLCLEDYFEKWKYLGSIFMRR